MTQVRNPLRVAAGAASSVVLAEDNARLDPVLIHNLGPATAYLDFGQPAELSDGWPLAPDAVYRFVSTLSWNAITDGGVANLAILVGGEIGDEGRDGAPLGTVGDPLQVQTQQPIGNAGDPVHVTGTVTATLPNPLPVSLPAGTPSGGVGNPLQVETQQPQGNDADPIVSRPAPVRRLVLAPWTYAAAVGEADARGQARAINNLNLRTWQIRHRFSAGATGTGTLHLHYQVADGSWYILGAMALTNAPTVANALSQLIEIPAPDGAVAVAAVYSDFVDGTLTIRITGIE